jgi:hypothetical protein
MLTVTDGMLATFEEGFSKAKREAHPMDGTTHADYHRAGLKAVFDSAEFAAWLNREVQSAQQH